MKYICLNNLLFVNYTCMQSTVYRVTFNKVKFWFVFRYEAVVFRRYVLALLSAGLLQKFQAYRVYLSLIWNKNPRPFSFFQKFRHFTYMLLWFRLIIPSFPPQIDSMHSRFSALSRQAVLEHCKLISISPNRTQKILELQLALWTGSSQILLALRTSLTCSLFFINLVGKGRAWALAHITNESEKLLPGKEISLSWTTGWHIFPTL